MFEKNRARRFLLPLVVIGLFAVLPLLLPLVPQPGLKGRLINEFSKALQQPCQVQDARLKLLPRPTIAVQGMSCIAPGFNFKVRSLDLDFSLFSLLSFSPLIGSIHLRGVLAEIPFASLFPEAGIEEETSTLSPGLLERVVKGKAQGPTLFSLHDAICKVTKIPGLKKPLLFTTLEGKWRSQPQNQSENLELAGFVNGGQGHLQVTWYKVDEVGAPESGLSDMDVGDRLEIACRLQGVSLQEFEAVFWGSSESRWQVDFEKGDLEFDVNGDPEAGLRFSGRIAAVEHHLSQYEIIPDSVQLWSQGALKANFSGFFQRREGYLNIKNAAFEYPGAATLFSRGLIRFRKPIFVDLVSHLRVDDLDRTINHCPLLQLSGYQCEGRLESDLKLVGNPFLAPVLQVELNSEKIVLREVLPLSTKPGLIADSDLEMIQPAPEIGEGTTLEAAADDRIVSSDYQGMAANFLRSLAKWEWIVKSDCRIGMLDLPELDLAELSFLAEKNLVQFEIERLAASFGKYGQVRLSLILDDLLHEPRWQASLVAEKLNLKPFSNTLSLTGILDASLVGEGRLKPGSEVGEDLVLNGKWQLGQGSFSGQPLFTAFKYFLEQQRGAFEVAGFSGFSGKFALREKVLRFDDLRLRSPESQLKARGRFFTVGERFDFRGQFSQGSSFLQSFRLTGNLKNPIFTADH